MFVFIIRLYVAMLLLVALAVGYFFFPQHYEYANG